MTESWLPSLIIGLLMAMLAVFGRVQLRSWLAPGAFFVLVWSAFILLALIVAPHYEVSAAAIGWIFASALAVYAGSSMGAYGLVISRKRRGAVPPAHFHFPWLRSVLTACIILGLGNTFVTLQSSGYSLTVLLSLDTLAQIGHEFSVARYGLTYEPPLIAQLLLVFVYSSPLFGGLLFVLKPSRFNRFLALLSLAPALLVILVHSTRAPMVLAGILWIASYLSARVLLEGSAVRLFTKGHLFAVLLLVPFLAALFIVPGLMFRRGLTVLPSQVETATKARAYLFGSLTVFSKWFQNAWYHYAAPGFGIDIIQSLFRVGDLPEAWPMMYELSKGTGEASNITTIFAKLIAGFTLPGCLLVLFAIGVLAGWSYYRVVHGQKLYLPMLIALYSFALPTRIFTFGSTIAGLLVFALYLLASKLTYSGSRRNVAGTVNN